MKQNVETVFVEAQKAGASDVHIAVGFPVLFRIHGILMPQTNAAATARDVEELVREVLGEDLWKRLEESREIDVSRALPGGVRLRVNCHFERGYPGLVARVVPTAIPSLADIGLEEIGKHLCAFEEGLILFTGPTGCGKSTSLAAMIQFINTERARSIVTLEDPIEFLFSPGKGIVRQRQMGEDFLSFAEALKRVVRQDPNIVMVGEMRDPETISSALTLAETGHLILATLHTGSAVQSIDRIVDVFPPHQQHQVRSQLSLSLRAVVAQRLLPREGGGRVALREVLMNTPAASNIIRENRLQELTSVVQTGKQLGMRTFAQDAEQLFRGKLVSRETYERYRE